MSISPGIIDINRTVLEISTRKLDNQFIFKFVKPVGITNQHPFSDYIYIYIYIYILGGEHATRIHR